jgi:hypothetical protein
MTNKVFISYAGEDKNFVFRFATDLRNQAIDAWVAEWEIGPGDSIVKKIFDDGLGMADAVIVVLSQHSVNKPWVRAELDVAKVRQIEEHTRLIPVIIDACDVPIPLRATRRERIQNDNDYQSVLTRIIMAINGMYEKPPLGTSPAYAKTPISAIRNLPQIASLMLELCYEHLLDRYPHLGHTETILTQAESLEIPRRESMDALDILDRKSYIKGHKTMGVEIFRSFSRTRYGLETYLTTHMPEYGSVLTDVIVQIEDGKKKSIEIAEVLGRNHLLVTHILEILESRQLVKLSKMSGALLYVWDSSPELKYMLQGA